MDNKTIGLGVFMRIQGLKSLFVTTILLLSSLQAFAGFSFEGYLADAAGNPISGSVTVHLKVVSPGAEVCPLFMEDHTLTVPADGYVSLAIGAGLRVDALPHTVDRAFGNYGSFSGLTGCGVGSTYTPVAGAKRLLNVSVTVGGSTEVLGSLDINPVPVAMNAEKLGVHAIGSLVRVENAGVPSAATALTIADFTNLQSLVAGSSSLYVRSTSSGSALPAFASNPGGLSAGNMWYDSTLHQVKFYDGTSVQPLAAGGGGVASVSAIAPLTAVAVSSAVTISMPVANAGANGYLSSADWNSFNTKLGASTSFAGDVSGAYNALYLTATGVSAGTFTKLTIDLKGRVTAATTISSADVNTALGYTALNKAGDTMTGVLGLYSTATDPSTAGWAASEKGRTWFNNSTNQIKYWDGAVIQVLGVAGSGLSSLNGQVGTTQSFSVSGDNSVTMPQVSSAANIHTFKFPQASAAGVIGGLVGNADYTNWNAKLGPGSAMAGDISGTFTSTHVDKLQGFPLFISSPSFGQVIRYNGGNWMNGGLDANDLISGTLPVNRGGTGATVFAANRVVTTNGTGTGLLDFTCSVNQVLTFDGSGNAICANVNGLLPPLVQAGGNSMGSQLVVGTNDGYGLAFRTGGTDRVTVDNLGRIGIGTNTPNAPLDMIGFMTMRGQASAPTATASQGNIYFNNTKNKFIYSENGGPYQEFLSANGNGMGQDILLGTNDSFKLMLIANGAPRVAINPSGNVGIGTTTPQATLDVSGHIASSGTALGTPSGPACGSSPSISGTDTRGKVTLGASPATGYCQINFMSSYMNPPVCVVAWASTPNGYLQVSSTTNYMQINFTTAPTAGSMINYICLQ